MIEFLRGELLSIDDDHHIIVDVAGVGYGLDVPRSTLEGLPAIGEEARLHVSMVVGDDSMRLYGFATPQEQSVFEIFLKVSGIGPRTALDVLSTVSISDFVTAVHTRDVRALTRIPGIGRKKAERLIVELKDLLRLFPTDTPPGAPGRDEGRTGGGEPDLFSDAVAALVGMGHRPGAASRIIASVLRDLDPQNLSLEDVVKRALQAKR